jgi:hypothetical protein
MAASTLSLAAGASDTQLFVTTSSVFPGEYGTVTIDSETINYTMTTDKSLYGCTRGVAGTTPATHALGATVTFLSLQDPGTGKITNADVAAAAGIAESKLASLAINQVVVTSGTGAIVAVATLPNSNTSGATTPTASTLSLRDANGNSQFNNALDAFVTTPTAAGTTTLTVASAGIQQFTGATTQTVLLPNATTLVVGHQFQVVNRSTGAVTVQNAGAVSQQVMAGGSQAIFTCAANGTANGTWDVSYTLTTAILPVTSGGTGSSTSTGSGSVVLATTPTLVGPVSVSTGNLNITTVGQTVGIKEGSNAKMGSSVLVAGSVVVANTAVAANSRILVTSQVDGGTPGFLRVSTRTAATSFTITSSSGTDTSTVAWVILDPQ